MPFHFSGLVRRYNEASRDVQAHRYPRWMAWEFLWDWVQENRTWRSLASRRNRRTTALHLGLYLANWGMMRGSSGLLNVNLDFFEDVVVALFGSRVPNECWDTTLYDFGRSDDEAKVARDSLAKMLVALREVGHEQVVWTETLVSKVLLGVWGQVPAFDKYFNAGLADYLASHPSRTVGTRTRCAPTTISDLAALVTRNRWSLDGYETRNARCALPPGKVLDMAFFQHGYELQQARVDEADVHEADPQRGG